MICSGELLFEGRRKLFRKCPPVLLPNFILEPVEDLQVVYIETSSPELGSKQLCLVLTCLQRQCHHFIHHTCIYANITVAKQLTIYSLLAQKCYIKFMAPTATSCGC